jgi:outer membrane biosynthesis protein TonB
MRKLFLILFCLTAVTIGKAQSGIDNIIKFDSVAHSFGKVKKGTPVTVEFTFVNPGKKPLIIEDATAECGCTKPEYPQQPIMAGKKGKIKVTYDAKEGGSFTKKVTVKLVNVTDSKVLTISGEVI